VVLRFRHPTAARIRSVTVSGPAIATRKGKAWKNFDAEKETITLKGLTGTVTVSARYGVAGSRLHKRQMNN
jgi:hypothetical protein